MKLTKTLAGLLLAGTMVLPSAAMAETTLNFVSWQVGEKGYGDWWAAVIEEFETTHPDVTIDFTLVPRDGYTDAMITQFAAGAPPDIVHLTSFEYQTFAENGWLEDLGPWVEKSGMDLTGWAGQSACVWKGTTNCIMLLYFGYILAYNEQLLEEAGVAVPTNWEEFLAAARATTIDRDGDGIKDVYGTGVHLATANSSYTNDVLMYVLSAGGRWTDSNGKVTINTPETIEGINRWRTLVEEELTPMGMVGGDTDQLFMEGKVAMRINGPWINGFVQRAEPGIQEHLKYAASPLQPPLGGSSNVITLAKETLQEKKELAWEFIQLATSQKFQELYSELGASPAPRPNSVNDAAFAAVPHMQLLIDATNAASAAGVDRIPTGLEAQNNEFTKIAAEEFQRMLIENLPTEQVAGVIQVEAEKLQ
ncbi:ABC transporter substrate-binding protein [Devosia lacusdianchii]|uniref:ABC transporter substrate-binding protein n=1 Tax=Devosia lacusdianchii TaxID=2917991 RepID=UPI001F05159D|nr:sugar ABC transporter substrate-binding protein [Devosia sp. JXJ CY 41]